MSRIRFCLTAIAVAAVLSSGAIAQTSVPSPATKTAPAAAPNSPEPSPATQVEKWTAKQWEAAKKEWAMDKEKWADCREQSRHQKLEDPKRWSFLYKCMTS